MENTQQMTHMENQLSELSRKVDKISEALLGNEFNKDGLVATVVDHEDRLNKLEDKGITDRMYMNILRFIAVSIGTGVLGYVLNLIFTKK